MIPVDPDAAPVPEPEDADADSRGVCALHAFVDYARLLWDAETTNSERYARQARLLITLALTLSGVLLYRLPDFATQLGRVNGAPWFWVAALMGGTTVHLWCRGVGTVRRRIAIMVCVFAVVVAALIPDVSVDATSGAILALVSYAIGSFVLAVHRLLKPPQSRVPRFDVLSDLDPPRFPPGPVEFDGGSVRRSADQSATFWLALSPRALDRVRKAASPEQWSMFWRIYVGAMDLRQRNTEMRDNIRSAQRLIGAAMTLIPVALFVYLVSSLTEG